MRINVPTARQGYIVENKHFGWNLGQAQARANFLADEYSRSVYVYRRILAPFAVATYEHIPVYKADPRSYARPPWQHP